MVIDALEFDARLREIDPFDELSFLGLECAMVGDAAIGPQLLPHITTAAGGVPIKAGGTTIGAVGVSGTPGAAGGGEGDAKCAAAGVEQIEKDLAAR